MSNEFVSIVDADVVLVTIVILTVLLCPPCFHIFLAQLGRILFPIFGGFTLFDLSVLFPAVALPRCGNQAGVNDLSFT